MLIETDRIAFRNYFPNDPNPFISEKFIEINRKKVDRVIRLIDDSGDPVIGLVVGIKNGVVMSPFSAPFGGFHFRKDNIYITEIDRFIEQLAEYAAGHGIHRIEISTSPDIYNSSFNAKAINSLIRHNYHFTYPDITNWVNLRDLGGEYSQKNSREYYRQANRKHLAFSLTQDSQDKIKIYELICQNRANFNRPVYMTFNDVLDIGKIWPVDFFKVETVDHQIVASAIFYRNHPTICYAVFWGDNSKGRPLRAMDFMLLNLFLHYKEAGFEYMDLGISTESGIPNEGLLRFKESHEAVSSLRYKFILELNKA